MLGRVLEELARVWTFLVIWRVFADLVGARKQRACWQNTYERACCLYEYHFLHQCVPTTTQFARVYSSFINFIPLAPLTSPGSSVLLVLAFIYVWKIPCNSPLSLAADSPHKGGRLGHPNYHGDLYATQKEAFKHWLPLIEAAILVS